MLTYLLLNIIVVLALTPALMRRGRPKRSWWLAAAVLLVLTAVFDNVIIGLGIVGYDPSKILGIYIGIAPIEDFFYSIAAIILVPALWERGSGRG